ncbi:MAG: M23 family metallopeptidase [Bacteroidales bacterium]|nr:M23 family metallopeptidase [Bacteroidales bacterium]
MTENKYNFNPETLDFEEKSMPKSKRLLISGISIFIGAIFIFIIIFIAFSYYFEAKNSKQTEAEYAILEEQYKNLLDRKKQNDEYLNELVEKDKKIYQAVFKSEPDNSVFERKNPYTKFSDVDVNIVIQQNNERMSSFEKETDTQRKEYKKILNILKSSKSEELMRIPAIQPIFNKNLKFPVYGFGKRIDQVYKSLVFHPGIDYAAPEGTAVFATADGKIEQAGTKRGLGKRIIINHENGYKTIYAHLGRINVSKGKKIKRGDKIGSIGMTGKSLIPHLHYELHYNGKPINPVNYFFIDLSPEEFYQIRLLSAKSGLSLD